MYPSPKCVSGAISELSLTEMCLDSPLPMFSQQRYSPYPSSWELQGLAGRGGALHTPPRSRTVTPRALTPSECHPPAPLSPLGSTPPRNKSTFNVFDDGDNSPLTPLSSPPTPHLILQPECNINSTGSMDIDRTDVQDDSHAGSEDGEEDISGDYEESATDMPVSQAACTSSSGPGPGPGGPAQPGGKKDKRNTKKQTKKKKGTLVHCFEGAVSTTVQPLLNDRNVFSVISSGAHHPETTQRFDMLAQKLTVNTAMDQGLLGAGGFVSTVHKLQAVEQMGAVLDFLSVYHHLQLYLQIKR